MTGPTLRIVPAASWLASQPVQPGQPLPQSDWALRGACVGRDPDLLFVTGSAQRSAARICAGCPVRLECLAEALDNEIEFGVWGGLTERQRRALVKKSPHVGNWRGLLEERAARYARDSMSTAEQEAG